MAGPAQDLMSFCVRETSPPAFRRWVQKNEEESARLDTIYQTWVKNIEDIKPQFEQHVYNNPEANSLDFKQHRFCLYTLLAAGEELVLDYVRLATEGKATPDSVQPRILHIEQELGKLAKALHEWHGPLEAQSDIPDSFKRAAAEAASSAPGKRWWCWHQCRAPTSQSRRW